MAFYISLISTILWFIFMIYLSHQDGEHTGRASRELAEHLRFLDNDINDLNGKLRRAAHIVVSAKRRICEVVSKGPVADALGRVQPGIRYTINAKKLIVLIDEAVEDTISYMKSCQRDDEYSMEIGEMEKVDAEHVIACATADFNEFLGDAYNCLVD